MPGRTAAEARRNFVDPLQKCLSCLTRERIFVRSSPRGDGAEEALTLSSDGWVRLHAAQGNIQLQLTQQFHVWQDDQSRWRVSTDAYAYTLDDDGGQELAAWHWHPRSSPHPHLHVKQSFEHAHLPTGRVSIESVLRLLLTDLGVRPISDHEHDYLQVLDRSESPFIDERTWHAWREAPDRRDDV